MLASACVNIIHKYTHLGKDSEEKKFIHMRSLNIKYVIQYANKWKPLYVNCKIQSYLV